MDMDIVRFLSALAHFLLTSENHWRHGMLVGQTHGGQPADRRHTAGEIVSHSREDDFGASVLS
jgi:hypothetical protein